MRGKYPRLGHEKRRLKKKKPSLFPLQQQSAAIESDRDGEGTGETLGRPPPGERADVAAATRRIHSVSRITDGAAAETFRTGGHAIAYYFNGGSKSPLEIQRCSTSPLVKESSACPNDEKV